MFDDIRNYFIENVLANYDEYMRTRFEPSAGSNNDLRLAINAATSLYHMREHMSEAYGKAREELAQTCPDYDLLGDVVNASKHKQLNRGNPQITSADALSEVIVITEYEDAQGPFHVCTKAIGISLEDGSFRELGELLLNVLNMWIDELQAVGIVSLAKRQFPSVLAPSRQAADGAGRLDLSLRRGERLAQRFMLKKYDSARGLAVPVDLSETSLQFNIYEPEVVTVKLEDSVTGERREIELPLTHEQSSQFHALANDDERRLFLASAITATEGSKNSS